MVKDLGNVEAGTSVGQNEVSPSPFLPLKVVALARESYNDDFSRSESYMQRVSTQIVIING